MGRIIIVLFLCAAALPAQDSAREHLNQGVRLYKAAKYAEAITAFEQAVNADPNNVNARLYLGTAYMTRWTPGLETSENREFARRAEEEFTRVLNIDPGSVVALRSLASLAFNQKRLDDAKSWNERILAVDVNDKEAYYSLGVIDWAKFYPELSAARQRSGMRPEDPGPIKDVTVREDLRNRLGPVVDDGISKLSKAIEIDPAYDDAMAYLNLLYRERGDLRDNAQDCAADVALADQWVQKALDTKRSKMESGGPGLAGAPPPPPPPPPSADGSPQRIRVGGNVQASNLIQKVTPAYPPEAKAARIQGTVRFQVVIGKDGHILDMQLVSGHPLLVPPSTEAVRQWVYRPTLLNGQPVEVITQIDVNYTLAP